MSDKRKLYSTYKKIKHFKPWYFLVLAVIFLCIGIYGLRQNSFEVIRLREAVAKADEQNGDVEKALRDLRQFVHGHMNTNLASGDHAIKPPIQLRHRYEELVKNGVDKTKAANQEIKQKAEAMCAQKFPSSGFNSPRVSCIADYVRDNAVVDDSIPSDLYKFDFVSPAWSPDLAGFGLLGAAVLFTAFVLRLMIGWWFRSELR